MGKAVEYGLPRYVIYDSTRDSENPMFNLSREAIAAGAKTIRPGDDIKIASPHEGRLQLEFSI